MSEFDCLRWPDLKLGPDDIKLAAKELKIAIASGTSPKNIFADKTDALDNTEALDDGEHGEYTYPDTSPEITYKEGVNSKGHKWASVEAS